MPNTVPAAAEGLPEINRRRALTVTGAGIVAALSGVAASIAAPASAAGNPDAELIEIGKELDREFAIEAELSAEAHRQHDIWRALIDAEGADGNRDREAALMDQCGYRQAGDDAWGECHERLDALAKRIDAIPAVTVAGFAAKAGALLWDMFLWESIAGEEPDYNEAALRKFIAAMRAVA